MYHCKAHAAATLRTALGETQQLERNITDGEACQSLLFDSMYRGAEQALDTAQAKGQPLTLTVTSKVAKETWGGVGGAPGALPATS